MCNNATYSFTQEMCCTFLPHFRCSGARGSHFTFHGFRGLEMGSWGHTDVTVHCRSSFVAEAEPLLDPSNSCQMGQFDPLFVLHQTQTITTSERVADNESVKSMFPCSVDRTRQNDKMFRKHSFLTTFHHVVCLSKKKSILLLSLHKVTIIHQQITLFKSDFVFNWNWSLESRSLIGISKTLYEWFTDLHTSINGSFLLDWLEIWIELQRLID